MILLEDWMINSFQNILQMVKKNYLDILDEGD